MGGFFVECTQYPDKAFSGVPQKNPELTSCAKLRKLKAERFFDWVTGNWVLHRRVDGAFLPRLSS
jgi:hypothetical protein